MVNAVARGRPTTPLVLSAQERAYLERQVRRHRIARSLSERCRVILRCADGLSSKSVAAEQGLHEHTVGKWRRRFLKDRCDGLLDEARPGRPRTIDDDQVAAVIERTLRTTPVDATHVDPFDGGGNRFFPYHDPPDVGGVRLAAAPQPDVQAVERSAVRRQGARYCRPLSLSAQPGSRPQHRREKPDPGTGSGAAGLTDDAWRTRTSHAQLRAAWHDLAVCRTRCRIGLRHRQVLQTPPGGRVPELPQRGRCSSPGRARCPYRHGQLCHPQDTPRSRRGSPAGRIIMSTSRRLRRHGSIRSSAGSLNSLENGSGECPYLRQAARGRHPHLHRPAQQKSKTFQMDQIRRSNPGLSQTLLPQSTPDFKWRTLDSRD